MTSRRSPANARRKNRTSKEPSIGESHLDEKIPSDELYRSILKNIMNGYALHRVIMDENGTPVDYEFLDTNSTFEVQTGLEKKEIIGKRVSEVLPGISADPANWINRYGKVAMEQCEDRFEQYSLILKKWYSVYAFSPKKGYFITLIEDITERKNIEREILACDELLIKTHDIARICNWNLDLASDHLTISHGCSKFFGLDSPETQRTFADYLDLVYPEDRSMLNDAFRKSIHDGNQSFEMIHRIVRKDTKEVRWIRFKIDHVKDTSGTITRSEGMIQDITESHLKDVEIRDLNSFLKSIRNVNQSISKASDFKDLLSRTASNLSEIRGYINISIAYRDPQTLECFLIDTANMVLGDHKSIQFDLLPKCMKEGFESVEPKIFPKGERCSDCDQCTEKRDHDHIMVPVTVLGSGVISVIRACISLGRSIHQEEIPLFMEVAGDIFLAYEKITTEKALDENVRKFRSLFENMPDGFVFMRRIINEARETIDIQFLEVNTAFELILGIKKDRIMGKSAKEVVSTEISYGWMELFKKIWKSDTEERFEHYVPDYDRWYSILAFSPYPEHFAAIFEDISERKMFERNLKYHASFPELNPNPVIEFDRSNNIKYQNPAAKVLFGGSEMKKLRSMLTRSDDESTIDRKMGNPVLAQKEMFSNGHYWLITIHQISSDGAVRLYAVDITKQKQSEIMMRENEERYMSIFRSNPAAIAFTRLDDGRLVDVNDAWQGVTGYTREEVVGHSPIELGIWMRPEQREDMVRMGIDHEKGRHEVQIRNKSGDVRDLLMSAESIELKGERFILTMALDITDFKIAVNAVRDLSLRQDTILSSVPDIIMEVDMDKIYTWANRAGYEFFGDDVIGKSASNYFQGIQDTYNIVDPIFHGSEGLIYVESWQRRKDGENRLLAWWCRVLKNVEGNIIGALSAAQDITERFQTRKQIEEEKNRAEFYLDLLSHDIGNIHQGIQLWTTIARSTGSTQYQRENALTKMEELETRSIRLVKSVLLLSRLKDMKQEFIKIDIALIIKKAIEDIKLMFAQRILDIHYVSDDETATIMAEQILEEVFLNILENAVKFQYADPARIEIEMKKDAGIVMIDIADHGIGISDEKKSKIFDRHIKGQDYDYSGIGLSLAKELVIRYGGGMEVKDRIVGDPCQGARFVISLPAAH